jgi:hypothetical protein
MAKRRTVLELTDEQWEKLSKAAGKIGLTIPKFLLVKGLEAANE